MTILWHQQARQDLKQAIVYCREEFGQHAAKRFADNIKRQVQLLSVQPYMGRVEESFSDETVEFRSLVVHKYYKLLYWVDEAEGNILIALLWNTRQSPDKLPKTLADRL